MMKNILNKILERQPLIFEEAKEIIYAISEEKINDAQIVAILVGLQMRGLQLEEIKGFREALLEVCIRPEIEGVDAIDLCGTGGDSKNTFNISTTTSFVLASMGYKVIKHGNYGVSSLCGSSNVLEELGFVLAVPICYCKVGASADIVLNIGRSGFDFKTLDYTADRYIIDTVDNLSIDKYLIFRNDRITV